MNEKYQMTNLNTKANRTAILNRIEKDGVNLSEFNKDQKVELIKTYAAVCLNEGVI
tara:strand:- start:965 stop:1132 length:168 start_codon:yes stop_codon:yes gene_type:complete